MTHTHLTDRLNDLFTRREGQAPEVILRDLVSFNPTAHMVQTQSGVRFFTYCALDTLLAAWLLDENIDIDTTPPGNSQPIRITVRYEQLHAPADAVIALPDTPDAVEVRQTFCPYANAFPDRASYESWASTSPVETTALPVSEVFLIARDIVERLKYLHTLQELGSGGCC
ncbi:organomercurial lyase [Deinococcus sp. YIM 77859]|uniref:organomercurial lyase n=1 Tax=Deinococcus sp. YIM 77859 TaxID=1540221 RepID=UPI000AA6F0F8|nr:organomercurial lyase [Deinococcus sp. YIM 77859]